MSVVTPMQVESRLKALSKELDTCHDSLVDAEKMYYTTKAEYEIAIARSRLALSSKSSPAGKNYTVGEREDLAIIENADLHFAMASAEALVRASRANAARIKTQVDIARSISVSVRSGMEL